MGSVSTGLLQQEISRLNTLLEEKIRECVRLESDAEEIRSHGQERIQTLEQQVGAPSLFWCICIQLYIKHPEMTFMVHLAYCGQNSINLVSFA